MRKGRRSWAGWMLVRRHHPPSTVSRRVGFGEYWALSKCVRARAYMCRFGAFFDCLSHVGPQDTRRKIKACEMRQALRSLYFYFTAIKKTARSSVRVFSALYWPRCTVAHAAAASPSSSSLSPIHRAVDHGMEDEDHMYGTGGRVPCRCIISATCP